MGDGRIRVGMTVRDAAGNRLGKVKRVHPWGFEIRRGLWSPYQWVARYDEVMDLVDGVIRIARRPDDLQRLAAGELPAGWKRHTPPFGTRPIPSAPGEDAPAQRADGAEDPGAVARPLEPEEERRFADTRQQSAPDAHAHS